MKKKKTNMNIKIIICSLLYFVTHFHVEYSKANLLAFYYKATHITVVYK